MTELQREAREAAKAAYPPGSGRLGHGIFNGEPAREGFRERYWFEKGYLAAAAPREQEIERLRAKLDEAKSAIRWMHGYDEPGTEDFPFCPEGKRFAWRSVARQQFAIVREACAEPIPLPETKA